MTESRYGRRSGRKPQQLEKSSDKIAIFLGEVRRDHFPPWTFYSPPMVQPFIPWLGLQGQRFDYFNQGCSNKAVTAQTVFSQLGTAGRYNKDDWSDWVMVQPNYHHNQYQHYQYHV